MSLILHEDPRSGNCYKIRLTAAHLGVPLERRFYDIMKGETRTPEFLAEVNANGRIPVLQDGDRFLPESNAACFYLADGSALIPTSRFERADMLRWMFWEQYNHEPNVATVRAWLTIVGLDSLTDAQRLNLPVKREAGEAALALMDRHLAGRQWLVGESISLADIALYPYTQVAGDGGFELGIFPHLCKWLDRVAAHPRHLPMDTETPLAARAVPD
jgi:glutathione S-transferase